MIQELFGVDGIVSACAVILFLVMVYAMNHLPKKKFSFAARVLMGAGCGTVFGLAVYALGAAGFGLTPSSVSGTAQWFSAASRIYLGLFRVLIGPVIFICTAHLVIHTPAFKVTPKEVKVKKQVNTFMVALSCGVGLVFGILFHVGSVDGGFGAVQAGGESLPQILLGLMPVNLAADLLLGKAAAVFIAGGLAGGALCPALHRFPEPQPGGELFPERGGAPPGGGGADGDSGGDVGGPGRGGGFHLHLGALPQRQGAALPLPGEEGHPPPAGRRHHPQGHPAQRGPGISHRASAPGLSIKARFRCF